MNKVTEHTIDEVCCSWRNKVPVYRKVSSPVVQYLIGASVNLLYVVILMTGDVSYRNIQLPEGIYADNLWKGTDVLTYVGPARNFVHYGVFGSDTVPDHHRTIGYPLFLSILMVAFGHDWLIAAVFLQALLAAAIYPALCRLSAILFDAPPIVANASFLLPAA